MPHKNGLILAQDLLKLSDKDFHDFFHGIKLLAFDVDDTLAGYHEKISDTTAKLLIKLLKHYHIAILTGRTLEKIQDYVIAPLNRLLINATSSPHQVFISTSGGGYIFRLQSPKLKLLKKFPIDKKDFITIQKALLQALKKMPKHPQIPNMPPPLIEYRETSIVFREIGTNPTLHQKQIYDLSQKRRRLLFKHFKQLYPDYNKFNYKFSKYSSIDITLKNVDKASALLHILQDLKLSKDSTVYFGDAFTKHSNDYPILELGVKCIQVKDPTQTTNILKKLI